MPTDFVVDHHDAPRPQAVEFPPGVDALEARLIGTSPGMQQLRWRISGLAPLCAPVLVSGEPGTGKRTVIAALHALGGRAEEPLTVVEAGHDGELPGPEGGAVHVRGVEALPEARQAAWARRLRRAELRAHRRDIRVFFSTTRPHALGADSSPLFHPELARHLLRFHLALPSLAQRIEDVPVLARGLARRIGVALGRPRVRVNGGAVAALAALPWPGNVAQLERLIELAVAFAAEGTIRRTDIESLVESLALEGERSVAALRSDRRVAERDALLAALHETGGNISRTARRLGRSRPTIYRMIERNGIRLRSLNDALDDLPGG